MKAIQILDIIKPLPLVEKLRIIELIFKDLRENVVEGNTAVEQREAAAALLLADYENDEELTAFTALDKDDFYEMNRKCLS